MPHITHDHAERELLGVVFHCPVDAAQEVGQVRESDFRLDAHQRIWQAICSLWDDRRPADLVGVGKWLLRKGWADDAGGSAYLAELIEATPSGANAAYYAGVVRDNALCRRLADEGRRLTQLAEEAGRPPAELLADVMARLDAMAEGAG